MTPGVDKSMGVVAGVGGASVGGGAAVVASVKVASVLYATLGEGDADVPASNGADVVE